MKLELNQEIKAKIGLNDLIYNRPILVPGKKYRVVSCMLDEHNALKRFAIMAESCTYQNFFSWEYEIFFEGAEKSTLEFKCTCGFVNGVSAVHYHWCDSIMPKSA